MHVVGGDKSDILDALLRVQQTSLASTDLAIVSISSHGFEENGTPYAMPADGLYHMLGDTALNLTHMQETLGDSKAGKRLFLIDTCQEKAFSQQTRGIAAHVMSAAFHDGADEGPRAGGARFLQPGAGSFESEQFHHGLFTYYLIQALHGGAKLNEQGFITLGSVSDYVSSSVQAWVKANQASSVTTQEPSFDDQSNDNAKSIPLAEGQGVNEKRDQRVAAITKLLEAGRFPAGLPGRHQTAEG